MSRCVGYLRLSRDDVRGPGTDAEKFEARAEIVRALAARYGDTLPEEAIRRELVTGTRLAGRPALLEILEMARRREIQVIYSPYQDRILRTSKTDEDVIESTFIRGRIILRTSEGEIDFGSEQYDPSFFEFRAMAGRAEVRRYALRRRETHKANSRLGRRDQGFAQYGYVWIPSRIDPLTRAVTERGHYEIIPDEYEVLCEMCRRAFTESVYSIVRDLNRRGIPPPGLRRRPEAASATWQVTTALRILHSPFIAGFPANRSRIIHGERRLLPESEWIMPGEEQEYPHPLRWSDWLQLQRILSARNRPGRPNTDSPWLLTGILFCPNHRPMRASGNGSAYGCPCMQRGENHPGMYFSRAAADAIALHCIAQALDALPRRFFPDPTPTESVEERYVAARQRLAQVERKLSDMEANFSLLIRSWGEERYESAWRAAESEAESARAELMRLAESLDDRRPGMDALVDEIRRAGLQRLWAAADPAQRRVIVRGFLLRIDVEAPKQARRHIRAVHVTMRSPIARYYAAGRLPVRAFLPHYMTRRTESHEHD